MTRDEILNMPAGFEMDKLIIDKVIKPDIGLISAHGFYPSKNYQAAFDVVEKLIDDGFFYSCSGNDVCGNLVFIVTFIRDEDGSGKNVKRYYSGITEHSLPLAICRAALLAVMEAE